MTAPLDLAAVKREWRQSRSARHVPALIARVEALEAENARLRAVREADIANALDDARDNIEQFMFCIDAQRWIANKVAALRAAGGG